LESGKHVISATVEADALCGVSLARKAKEAGVIYSMAYGDQPAMVCELVDWARVCGFEVVAAGRGHKWIPEYRYSTPDTIWNYWGLSPEQAKRGRLNPKMFNSFLDGTKPAIESSAISNATGLLAPTEGLNYPSGTIDQIPMLMRPRVEGGILNGSGFVEVINSLDSNGGMLDYDIRKGVWVNLKAANDYQKNCFEEYKVQTDDSGEYFTSYKRWHLIGLELGLSVANVGIRNEPTGVATDFLSDVVTIAKRDLKIGEILDGEGGYTVSGDIRPSIISVRQRALPLGLTAGAKMLKDVKANSIIRYDDISIEHQSNAYKLRKILEKEI
jgi:predicted homoserine dehydrogenase-like protein